MSGRLPHTAFPVAAPAADAAATHALHPELGHALPSMVSVNLTAARNDAPFSKSPTKAHILQSHRHWAFFGS